MGNIIHIIPTTLSQIRNNLAATSVGNGINLYALFGGGTYYNGYSSVYYTTIDAYDSSLTRLTPDPLSKGRYYLAATKIGSYALFGGGYYGSSTNIVDAYNTSLTRSTPTVLSAARYTLAATKIGSYALFGGGDSSDVVDAYNTSLTRSIPSPLSRKRGNLSATSNRNYAIFGGGQDSSYRWDTTDAYDSSLTKPGLNGLNMARSLAGAINTVDYNYALFGGGYTNYTSSPLSDVVDAYNTSLTRSTPTVLSAARYSPGVANVSNYSLFGGGGGSSNDVVDAYNTSLTRSIPSPLSRGRDQLSAASVGSYALFGGGGSSDVVDAYLEFPYVNKQIQKIFIQLPD